MLKRSYQLPVTGTADRWRIFTEAIPPGVYALRVRTGDAQLTQLVLKE